MTARLPQSMPIKNYTTKVPASKSIAEIQDALVKHGATGVLYKYEKSYTLANTNLYTCCYAKSNTNTFTIRNSATVTSPICNADPRRQWTPAVSD